VLEHLQGAIVRTRGRRPNMSIISLLKPRTRGPKGPKKYKTLADVLANTTRTRNGCMEWNGTIDNKGYGRTYHEGRSGYKAHRLSMKLAGYNIDGWVVCHKCDNPPCINPDHLFLGTISDNIHDAQSKGRFPIAKPKPPTRPRNTPAICGTKGGYQAGCKCRACVAANRDYMRQYRKRQNRT
jgi:hypothetical protein